jgi:hypothetical protein
MTVAAATVSAAPAAKAFPTAAAAEAITDLPQKCSAGSGTSSNNAKNCRGRRNSSGCSSRSSATGALSAAAAAGKWHL